MNAGFSYFELHTPDLQKAQSFYGALFGWTFKTVPIPGMQYATIETGKGRGGMMKADRPMWLSFVSVEDVAEAQSKAEKLGGRVLQPKTEIPGQGAFAVIADPGGAPFALWQQAAAK